MSLPDSSIDDVGYLEPTPLPQNDWDLTARVPAKSSIMDYGYFVKEGPVGCTVRELVEAVVERRSEISFVWTPGTPQPVRPEQVPFLIGALRDAKTREARNWIMFGGGAMILALTTAYYTAETAQLSRNVFLAIGAFCLAMGNTKYWRSRSYTQENALSDESTARFETWVQRKDLSVYTIAVIASCLLVTIVGGVGLDTNALAGLVKSAVWSGEVWRLFTAPLLHASLTHVLISAWGLLHFSKIAEQTIHRAFLPLLFLVTAVAGSVASLLFDPVITSMGGAMGGLMGLIGFIASAAFLDRTNYPAGYFKRMLVIVVGLFAVNLFGYEFFDPTAAFGGLMTGGILGSLISKLTQPPIAGKLAKVAGAGGVLALVSTAVFALSRLIT